MIVNEHFSMIHHQIYLVLAIGLSANDDVTDSQFLSFVWIRFSIEKPCCTFAVFDVINKDSVNSFVFLNTACESNFLSIGHVHKYQTPFLGSVQTDPFLSF